LFAVGCQKDPNEAGKSYALQCQSSVLFKLLSYASPDCSGPGTDVGNYPVGSPSCNSVGAGAGLPLYAKDACTTGPYALPPVGAQYTTDTVYFGSTADSCPNTTAITYQLVTQVVGGCGQYGGLSARCVRVEVNRGRSRSSRGFFVCCTESKHDHNTCNESDIKRFCPELAVLL
jgi:hypothetical protein